MAGKRPNESINRETLEQGKTLFYRYLYHSRAYFTDPESHEQCLKEIDWDLAALGLAISVNEEESEEQEDPERGIEIFTMPAYLITTKIPVLKLDEGTLVYRKPGQELPMNAALNAFDIGFLKNIPICI